MMLAELGLFLVHEFRSVGLNSKKLAQNSTDGEFRLRISRTSYCSTRKEPDSRPSFRTGREACAALCATSREIGY